MQTDCHLTVALIQKPFKLVFDANAAHCNAFGTPCPSVIGCKYFSSAQYIVQIVHGFTLSHKYDIGEFVNLWQAVNLV